MFSRNIKKFTCNKNLQTSFYSTQAKHAWFGPKLKRTVLYTAGITGSAGLIYYLSTDRDRMVEFYNSHERVPKQAIYPELGGAKNLPVATHLIDDTIEDKSQKPRLVIIGSGWGAVSVLKNLDKNKYDVTVVSENNYFLFTPLLPSGTVGTLELR